MDQQELAGRIQELKRQKDALIVAHNYQLPEVQDIADFTGDSLELARKCASAKESVIVFCGVKFMAETAKVLSPLKTVLLPRADAGCPLADCITFEQMKEYKEKYPDYAMVGYVNTNADVKTLLDYCVTSANAVDIVRKIPNDKIVFLPDKNLGAWVKKYVPEKEIIIHDGGCFVHQKFSAAEVKKAKAAMPDAVILAHPECNQDVLELSDKVASTSGMIKAVKESPAKKFIIGTEEGHIYRLKKERPDAEFYSLGSAKICINMKKTRLEDIRDSLIKGKTEIKLDAGTIEKAGIPIKRMVEL